MPNCICRTPPFNHKQYRTVELGEDTYGAKAFLWTCKSCRQAWLRYSIEEPHDSRSARWWLVAVPADRATAVTAATARAFVQAQLEGFVGGSFFDSTGRTVAAPIRIR